MFSGFLVSYVVPHRLPVRLRFNTALVWLIEPSRAAAIDRREIATPGPRRHRRYKTRNSPRYQSLVAKLGLSFEGGVGASLSRRIRAMRCSAAELYVRLFAQRAGWSGVAATDRAKLDVGECRVGNARLWEVEEQ